MSYTPEQLADLYGLAVSAEAEEKREDAYKDETYALDEAVLQLAPGGYAQLIRTLIDNLRECCRRAPAETAFPVAFPKELHPETRKLVINTAHALAVKLNKAQEKRPNAPIGWKLHPWRDECRASLLAHIEKGDPLDVMAYAAFMHYHGWSTAPEKSAMPPINTGLSWEDYRGISSRADVHDAVQDLMGDTTEDNACNLVRAIAEALRPRPRFWIDMHGYSCHLLHSEADAIAHCNETGGLYVLPLFAGEPINTKLPMRMCRPAEEPQTVEVSALLRNLQAIPQKYTSDHVSLGEVFAVIEALRAKP